MIHRYRLGSAHTKTETRIGSSESIWFLALLSMTWDQQKKIKLQILPSVSVKLRKWTWNRFELVEDSKFYTILKIVCDRLLRAFMFVSPKCLFTGKKKKKTSHRRQNMFPNCWKYNSMWTEMCLLQAGGAPTLVLRCSRSPPANQLHILHAIGKQQMFTVTETCREIWG